MKTFRLQFSIKKIMVISTSKNLIFLFKIVSNVYILLFFTVDNKNYIHGVFSLN